MPGLSFAFFVITGCGTPDKLLSGYFKPVGHTSSVIKGRFLNRFMELFFKGNAKPDPVWHTLR
jgi:hypothetical protein